MTQTKVWSHCKEDTFSPICPSWCIYTYCPIYRKSSVETCDVWCPFFIFELHKVVLESQETPLPEEKQYIFSPKERAAPLHACLCSRLELHLVSDGRWRSWTLSSSLFISCQWHFSKSEAFTLEGFLIDCDTSSMFIRAQCVSHFGNK